MVPLLATIVILAVVGYYCFRLATTLHRWASVASPRLPTPASTGTKRTYTAENPEVIIIGAGVVGATMAIQFGRQGRQVTVVERYLQVPDRIVGEFLQPGGFNKMVELGIDDCLEDIDAVVTTGYVIYRTKDETINLPFSMKNPSERYTGRAFHNDRLLTKLRAKALEFPTVRIIQGTVESLIESGAQVTGVTYTVEGDTPENKRTIKAPLTLVADGCFSKFLSQTNDLKHRFPKENPKTISSNFTGIVLRNIEMPHEGCGHVMLTSPTPMLFYRISSTEVRALVDVPKDSELPSLDHIREVVAPQLPPKLKKALLDAMDEQDNCKTMPNFKLHPSPLIRPGMIVLGDALNIRHPLTGGGMTVAFSDMARVTPLLAPISDFASHTDVMNAYKHFFAQRKALASTVNILAQALYRVFGQCSDDERVSAMIRSACFAYFQLGGECVNGPISLLSGVIESPWTLLYHYARVGIYGAWIFKTQPIMAVKILIAVYHVFKPLMESELDSQAAEWAPSPSQ